MAIPPYYPLGGPGGVYFSNMAANADFVSPGVSIGGSEGYSSLSFQFDWTGFNSVDAVVTIQSSNNNVAFSNKTKADGTVVNYTFAAASGSQIINLNGVTAESYYCVSFAHGTNSAGTISCILIGKR